MVVPTRFGAFLKETTWEKPYENSGRRQRREYGPLFPPPPETAPDALLQGPLGKPFPVDYRRDLGLGN